MGVLVPSDFPLSLLKNDAERLVVESLCDRLTDGWLVLPNVTLSSSQRDFEIDVVIAHERDGIAVIEVKGHRPHIRDGLWYSGLNLMVPQPLAQATENAYELRRRLRALHPTLSKVNVEYAVAFPNVAEVHGELPAGVNPSQVLTCGAIEDLEDAIGRLMTYRWGQHPLGQSGVQAVVDLLRPSCEFRWESEARARLARLKLETICEQQVRALESLDLNRQVCVTGAAGTGKTRLAISWTRRALLRGERVLLTCFNLPLAASFRERLGSIPDLRIGGFHEIALTLAGMPALAIPDGADADWWHHTEMGHLLQNWKDVTERFDTIVIDEAQDFNPAWVTMLAQLLDPHGPRRVLMVADQSQQVYQRGFSVPSPDDGWVRCELNANCRNTFQIAGLLRRQFNGAVAPVGGPESEDVTWIEADDLETLTDATGEALDRLEGREHAAHSVLVATFTGTIRDHLIDEYGFVRWEQREPMAILCENVHRIKGLEYDHVILVAHDDAIADDLLYVGASRAVMSLTVVGSRSIADRMGLTQP